MKKITGAITILIFLLCAFSAQAASTIDVSVPSAGESCSSDLDCGDNENCINDICIPSAGEPCTSDLSCTLGGSCVENICVPSVGDPCSSDLDCGNGSCVDEICIPSVGAPCSSDLDCEPDEVCVNDICVPSAGQPCTNDLQCSEGELCINDICQEAECETSEDCDEGLICDNASSFLCVECLADSNCEVGEFCSDNNTCEDGGTCELIIKPPRINISKKKNPEWVVKKLKVKGNENFDAYGEIVVDDPFFLMGSTDTEIKRKRNKLKFVIQAYTDVDPGFYPIRVGNCIGEIELYDKKNK